MRVFRYFIYTSCLLMTACHSSMEHQLIKIDEQLNQHPDSALFALKQIDTSRIAGKRTGPIIIFYIVPHLTKITLMLQMTVS